MKSAKPLAIFGGIAAFASIAFLLWHIDWAGFADALGKTEWIWLLPALACNIVAVATRSARLSVLLGSQARFGQIFHIQNIGYLVNAVVPLRMGELAMILLIGRETSLHRLRIAAVIFVDRILDLLVAILIFATIVPYLNAEATSRFSGLTWIAAAAALCLFAPLFALHFRRIIIRTLLRSSVFFRRARGRRLIRWFDQLAGGASMLMQFRGAMLSLAASCLFWFVLVLTGYCVIRSTVNDTSLLASAFTVASSMIGIAVTSAPGGVGVTHAVFVFALGAFNIQAANALIAGIAFHALGIATYILLGLIGLRHFGLTLRKLKI